MANWKTAQSSELAQWVRAERLGIITDVDGTISPIAPTPEAAQVTPNARKLLTDLVGIIPLVGVISGRGAADVQARVGVPGMVYIGNHGLERWLNDAVDVPPHVAEFIPAMQAARDAINAKISAVEGMRVEDKGATLSVHYRLVDDHEAVKAQYDPVVREIAEQHGLRVFAGRMIFEVRPPIDMNKGSAFDAVVREFKLDAAVYLGDDTTDIDAIKAAQALRQSGDCLAYGLGVASDETPQAVIDAADYTADGIRDVEAFFAWVLSNRK